MTDSDLNPCYQPTQDPEMLAKLKQWVEGLFAGELHKTNQIAPHLWTVDQQGYKIFLMVTHLLVIFDAPLFPELAKEKTKLFEALLELNAHQTKQAKLCLVDGKIHLRIVYGYGQINEQSFAAAFEEFGDLFPLAHETLATRFYSDPADTPRNPAPDL